MNFQNVTGSHRRNSFPFLLFSFLITAHFEKAESLERKISKKIPQTTLQPNIILSPPNEVNVKNAKSETKREAKRFFHNKAFFLLARYIENMFC